jgi:hypothetical protein
MAAEGLAEKAVEAKRRASGPLRVPRGRDLSSHRRRGRADLE